MIYLIGINEVTLRNINRKYSPNKLLTTFVLFLLFFGFRWHILSDSLAYYDEFQKIEPIFDWKYIDEHSWWWDKGYVIFTMIIKLFCDNFSFFVFINSLIDFTLFFLCLKKYSINIPLSCLLFLSFQGILIEINLFRNIKAIMLFIYSISYIKDRNLLKFIICNGIGFTLHSSALLYLPMYWILNYKFKKVYIIIISLILTILYLSQANYLEKIIANLILDGENSTVSKLSYYLKTEGHSLTFGTIERIGTLLLSLYVYYKSTNNNYYFILFFNSYIVFYALFALFGFNLVLVDRLPTLFYYSYWFLYPYIYLFFKNKIVIRYCLLAFFLFKVYTSTNFCSAYYENVFLKSTTIREREILLEKS